MFDSQSMKELFEKIEHSDGTKTFVLLGREQLDFLTSNYPTTYPTEGKGDMRFCGIQIIPVNRKDFMKLVKEVD